MIDETTHDVRTAVHVHGLGFGVLVLGRASGFTVFSFVCGCWCLRSLGFRVQDLGFSFFIGSCYFRSLGFRLQGLGV